ncbi:effector-associated constant component EACC1 [Saccharopolyspora sp. NPDC002578]
MDVAVRAVGPDSADRLRSLHQWLRDVDELRGRVSALETPPPPDALGPVLDAVAPAVKSGAIRK